MENNRIKKRNVWKTLLALGVAFGPAMILLMASFGGCKNNFETLPVILEMPEYHFEGVNGQKIDNTTLHGKVVLFNTLQTSCPQHCAIDIFRMNMLIYQEYRKNQKRFGDVKIVSIITDENGNPIDNLDEMAFMLGDMIENYDSSIWLLASGDPKQIYDIENNGINLYETTSDSAFSKKSFLEVMLLVDKENRLRSVRRGNIEGMIRDFKNNTAVLLQEYKKEEIDGNE